MRKLILVIFIVLFCTSILISAAFGIALYELDFYKCPHSSFERSVISPSCTEEGRTLNKCKRCGYRYTSKITAPTGHSFKTLITQPTCTVEGKTLYYCKCGYSYFSDITPPTEHSLERTEVEPTCTEQGYCSYTCSECSYSFKGDICEPLGHSFTAQRVLPTATRAGYTQYTCECSYSYIGDHVYYSDILESAYTQNTVVLSKGLDVSRWNHQIDVLSGEYLPIDWQTVAREGFDFVILKAGSTKSGIEPTFEQDYSDAKAAGLCVGAYFYTYATSVDDIIKDARMLLQYLKGKQFEYPIYLDLEDASLSGLGKSLLSSMCIAFIEELQANGYYAGLYTNNAWLTTILDTPKIVSLIDIWYARYPGTDVPVWNEEKYGKQLGMWQYTQSGRIDGIDGEFDFNYSYKDYASIMRQWGLNGY